MSASLLGAAMKAKLGSRTRKLVLIKLVDCCHEDGTKIFPALGTVAEDAECSTSTARRVIKEFCAVGLLRKIRDGGSGPGSTAQYEMDIDLLARLRRPETWPALEAAAVHDPLPDSDDDEPAGHAQGAGEAPQSSPPCENKGVTVEGFHGATLPNGELRVPSGDTQPLTRTLKPEREGAQAREQGASPDGAEPVGSEPGDESQPTATLAEFRKAWPTTSIDNNARVQAAWEALPFGERRAAIDGIAAYLAELKRHSRGKTPAGSTYLADRKWRDVPALAAERQGQGMTEIAPWSRDWWLLLIDKLKAGQRVAFTIERAESGKGITASGADIASAGRRQGELLPFRCDGPEIEAWRPWLAARGARIPSFKGEFRVFLPGPVPPGGKMEEGDEHVRF